MMGPHALDDHFLLTRVEQVIREQSIETVVETGLANGDSSVKFCGMVSRFVGVDIDPDRIETARHNIRRSLADDHCEWYLRCGDSPTVLRDLMPTLNAARTLFFLDAHNFPRDPTWPKPTWPLPDEIRAIPRGQGVLLLHDFSVPGKDFGVDGYWVDDGSGDPANRKLVPFDYELIKDVLTEWSPTHRVEYMQESDPNSSYRGAAFVYPS